MQTKIQIAFFTTISESLSHEMEFVGAVFSLTENLFKYYLYFVTITLNFDGVYLHNTRPIDVELYTNE